MGFLDDLVNNYFKPQAISAAGMLENLGINEGFTGDPIVRDSGQIDFGTNEKIQQLFFPNTAYADENLGGNLLGEGALTPVATNDIRNISGTERQWADEEQNSPDNIESNRISQLTADGYTRNPAEDSELRTLQEAANTGGGGETEDQRIARLFAEEVALARKAAEAGRVQAQQGWDRAKGIHGEGMATLGTRRGEFTDIFNRGSNQILGRYEQERGNLQAGNKGANERMRNSMRALGMGGSAFQKGQGRLRQQAAGQLGNLSEQRSDNDLANLTGYNTNNEWAQGQETGLDRFLQGATDQMTNANNQISLAEQGDVNQINQNVSNFMAQMDAQNAALRAAQGNIGGYSAGAYAPDMSSFAGVLSGGGANVGGNQQTGNQASSVTQDGYTLADLLRQQAGGNMYT